MSSADLWAALLFLHSTGPQDREKKNAAFSKARN